MTQHRRLLTLLILKGIPALVTAGKNSGSVVGGPGPRFGDRGGRRLNAEPA